MPNLYFCESDNQSRGILRAVLSWEDCNRVVNYGSAVRLGDEFPCGSINGRCPSTVAVLYVRPEEASEKWCAGFYRIDTDVMEIDKALRMVPASLPIAHHPDQALPQDCSKSITFGASEASPQVDEQEGAGNPGE